MPPAPSYQVAVLGLGAAGAATLRALARRGVRAVGLDRHSPPHALGASHGETRLLRVAYGEGEAYVPMARRAVQLWRDLEAAAGTTLFEQTGLTFAGPADSAFLAATRRSAALHGLPLPDLSKSERDALHLPSAWSAFNEPSAGFLHTERALEAVLGDARAHGATVLTQAALSVEPAAGGLSIATASGPIRAQTCVVAAGAWTPELLPELAPLLRTERRTLHWFADPEGRYRPDLGFRPFFFEFEPDRALYGFPNLGGGDLKVAIHESGGPDVNPGHIDRTIHAEDLQQVETLARRHFPHLGPLTRSAVCMYPMSADGHFIIDRLPDDPRVVVAAGLSGHGFKFSPVIGEACAALACGEAPDIDLSSLSLARFG